MLIAALILNLIILIPVVTALVSQNDGMQAVYGPPSDARRILTCLYAAIALVSAGLLVLHVSAHPWALPMTAALFGVQMVYKTMTVPAVGLASPVVKANAGIVAIQLVAIVDALVRSGAGAG